MSNINRIELVCAIEGKDLVVDGFSNTLDEYGRLVLDKNDLLFGEGGNDYLYGHGGTDVIYGGEGRDTLVGGAGDDHLEGGEGFDTYRWSTGDGNDRIEDSDADGVIFVNGQMLVGGVKKADQTDWESADGTITYRMSGTDLVVELNGTQILTVNENFQSGQFGIRLIDRSSDPTDTPPVVDYTNGFSTEVVFADEQQSGSASLGGSGQNSINYIIHGYQGEEDWHFNNGNLGSNQIFAANGDDVVFTAAGHDRILGGEGNDIVFAGAGDDAVQGDDGDDVLKAGTGQDFLDGGVGNDVVLSGPGKDVLLGGDGADFL